MTASATVTTGSGPPQGDVVFAVDDLRFKANLGAGGDATIVLPRLTVGQHPVTATFVPQLPDDQQGSTSPAQGWVVSAVRTRLQVRVIGRGARIPTSVEVKAAGEFGTQPTGRVKVRVRPPGHTGRDARGPAAGPGRSGAGRAGQAPDGHLPPRGDLRRRQPAPAARPLRALPRERPLTEAGVTRSDRDSVTVSDPTMTPRSPAGPSLVASPTHIERSGGAARPHHHEHCCLCEARAGRHGRPAVRGRLDRRPRRGRRPAVRARRVRRRAGPAVPREARGRGDHGHRADAWARRRPSTRCASRCRWASTRVSTSSTTRSPAPTTSPPRWCWPRRSRRSPRPGQVDLVVCGMASTDAAGERRAGDARRAPRAARR